MGWFKQQTLSLIIVFGIVPGVVSNVALTSIPSTTQPICPGETIEFTCTTTGSPILLWTSDEYIGVGNQFQFRSFDPIGTTASSTNAIANLTAVNGDTLTSTLRIALISNIPSSTIICINSGLGTSNTSTVQVADIPEAPLNVGATAVSQLFENDCEIAVKWDPPANSVDITHYLIYVPALNLNVTTIANSLILYSLLLRDCPKRFGVKVAAVNCFGCVGINSSEVHVTLQPTSESSRLAIGAGDIAEITLAVVLVMLIGI